MTAATGVSRPPRVLASEDRHLTHRRVLDRNLLDIPRIDVHASPLVTWQGER